MRVATVAPDGRHPDLAAIGLEAARRAVRVEGDPALVSAGAHVVELAGPA